MSDAQLNRRDWPILNWARPLSLICLMLALASCQRNGHPMGPTCSAPSDVAYHNTDKRKVLDADRFFLFKRGISGYINPPSDGDLVLKITDEVYGDVLPRCGDERHFRLQVSRHHPANERYFIRFPIAAMGDGGINFVWELFFEPADGSERQRLYRRTRNHSAQQELFGFDWFDLLDQRFQINSHYYPDWQERAHNSIRRQDYQAALKDYKTARKILSNRKYLDGLTDKQLDSRIVNARDYYQILRHLVLLSLLTEDYRQASRFSQELLAHPTYGTTKYDEASSKDTVVSRDQLFLWYALQKSGSPDASDRLNQALVKARDTDKKCYQDFAAFLLNEIEQEEFLSKQSQKAFSCRRSGQGGKGLRYFWSGLKADISSDITARQTYLNDFYERSDRRAAQAPELLIAHQLLEKKCHRSPRPYSKKIPWKPGDLCDQQSLESR